MSTEYIIYCDESEDSGRHYSNFYGGALVRSVDLDFIKDAIAKKKAELNLHGEVKWSKISTNYHKKYIELVEFFFDFICVDKIKVRIMFTQNTVRARRLTKRHIANQYSILYYLFLRHAFGLQHSPAVTGGVDIRVYPDKMPTTAEQVAEFRHHLANLTKRADFRRLGLRIAPENVAEVVSHDHDILQCLDIVLGAIAFRMNDRHLDRPEGARRRSKKTLARERVYKRINARIRECYPNFNIGISTGHQGDSANRWHHPYRHWLFRSSDSVVLPGSKRPKKRKSGTP
jgi:hypothetical protein